MNIGSYDPENCDGHYVLDDQGNPKEERNLMKWAKSFEGDSRIIKQEQVGRLWVSTVFLGLDHSFRITEEEDIAPVLWETMVFGISHFDQEMDRCSGNREQAEAMHDRMVARMTEAEGLWIYASFLWTFFRWVNYRIVQPFYRRIKRPWCRMFHSKHWKFTSLQWIPGEVDGDRLLCSKCYCLPFYNQEIPVKQIEKIPYERTNEDE